MFKPAKQNRIYEDVVEQIQEAILDGTLKVGEQLPAERKLIEMFGVSRGTLREALRVLQQKGMIEIKTGVAGGSIVKGISTDQMSESLALLIRYRKISLEQLAEFREGVEGLVAALAAARASADDCKRLQLLLEEAGAYLDEGAARWDDFIRKDEEIHLAIAEISANQIHISVLRTIYDNIHTYYENYLAKEEPFLVENYRDLQEMVAAVISHNSEAAQALTRKHVRKFNQYMQKKGAV